MAQCAPSTSTRPTLPPLHTLGLPIGKASAQLPHIDELYDSYDFDRQTPRLHIASQYPHARQASISSSRTPSPTPSISPLRSTRPTLSHSTLGQVPAKIRLVPTTLEKADAVVVVPPPNAPHIPPLSGMSPTTMKQGQQALLLVGPALQHLRHPQRQLAKGARIHPYRIVRGSPDSRRTSSVSTTSA
ncbi:hypothetical protein BV22DRAFT_1046279 [Leucogyrophana mollusca]|uniref:Uncharacterized protein n=1 Tax=Leucogyrophana mollusca TaxID=85980 RepID=A0ACB8BMR8_9AGAM|nr:hypothetical protein BV22DRAFT_1046279 [Leucogyrophana mollusca]